MKNSSIKQMKEESKKKPEESQLHSNEKRLMQSFYGQRDSSKKLKNEKDNLKEFYKPL